MVVQFIVFLTLSTLICRGTDISKCFIESLGIRDNESRLYIQKASDDMDKMSNASLFKECMKRQQKQRHKTLKYAIIHLKECFKLYHSLCIFRRWHTGDISFLFFPRKQALTFHVNYLLRRKFTWNFKACFLAKISKIFQNVCWNFYRTCEAY